MMKPSAQQTLQLVLICERSALRPLDPNGKFNSCLSYSVYGTCSLNFVGTSFEMFSL